jgi:hypothetical protein
MPADGQCSATRYNRISGIRGKNGRKKNRADRSLQPCYNTLITLIKNKIPALSKAIFF